MATHSFAVPTHLISLCKWLSAQKRYVRPQTHVGIFIWLVGSCISGTICKYENWTQRMARNICGVSWSVLCSRMQQLGISYKDWFSRLDNNGLDAAVTDIKMNHPNCGEVMIIGILRARGMIVQQSRVCESIHGGPSRCWWSEVQKNSPSRLFCAISKLHLAPGR